MIRRTLLAAVVLFCAVTAASAAIVVDVGTHELQPNTADQWISIPITGGEPLVGVTINVQIADGFSIVPSSSIDGPNITEVDLLSGIFNGNNTGPNHVSAFDQFITDQTSAVSEVTATGILIKLKIDTTGFFYTDTIKEWALMLGGTAGGDSMFVGPPPSGGGQPVVLTPNITKASRRNNLNDPHPCGATV